MAQAPLNFHVSPSFSIPKTLIIHSHSLHILKNPSLNSRRRLLTNRIRCSASSDGGNTLRTCKNCKTQFDPLLNHPRACRFHTAHFGGETKRKFESVYSGGTMDTPNSGKVLQYWHCCGSEDPFDSGSKWNIIEIDMKVKKKNKKGKEYCFVKMGDHLVLVVDRLSNESGLVTVNQTALKADTVKEDGAFESVAAGTDDIWESQFVQCRICHDEDEDSNMDTPCSCSGTLKFAHHSCVQRWCNEKGDTVCEICRQQYNPGYTVPRQLFHYTGISMNFRSDWGIEGLDLRNPYFLTWDASDDHELYSFHSPTSLNCCRLITLLFILLLFLRHSLPVFLGGIDDFSLTLLMLPLLKTLGIFLVAYFFAKSFTAIQRCRQERDTRLSGFSSDEETAPPRILMALPEANELHVPVEGSVVHIMKALVSNPSAALSLIEYGSLESLFTLLGSS